MDLSSDGNVFGLDETRRPTLEDLRDRFDDPAVIQGVRDTGGRVTLAIFRCPKPVIGAINGPAVGIGATMTLPMDVRLASSCPRASASSSAGSGSSPRRRRRGSCPASSGISRALEWVYTADILGADEALAGGLVRSVHAPDELLGAAYDLARRFTEHRSPVAVALARQMMWRNSAQPHPVEAHRVDSLAMFYTSIGDGREGVAAFREKRDPDFTGRTTDMPPFYPWQD